MSGLGIACADTMMAIFSFTVYALLKSQIDRYDTTIQICGGVFVIAVGIFIFFKNPVPQIRKNRAGRTNLWQDFGSMFGFTLANFVVVIPYILAFFTMFSIDLNSSDGTAEADAAAITLLADEDGYDATISVSADAATSIQAAVAEPEATAQAHNGGIGRPMPRIMRDVMVITGFFLRRSAVVVLPDVHNRHVPPRVPPAPHADDQPRCGHHHQRTGSLYAYFGINQALNPMTDKR